MQRSLWSPNGPIELLLSRGEQASDVLLELDAINRERHEIQLGVSEAESCVEVACSESSGNCFMRQSVASGVVSRRKSGESSFPQTLRGLRLRVVEQGSGLVVSQV